MAKQETQLLCMPLDDVLYGIELAYVVETVRDARISRLPFLPAHYLGVCSRMGEVTPVVSLRRLCGRTDGEESGHTMTVMLRCGAYECGVLTRERPVILTVDEQSRMQGLGEDVSGERWQIKALYAHEGKMLLVVDVEKSLERMVICG